MGRRHVQRDIAFAGLLVEQLGGKLRGIRIGVADKDAPQPQCRTTGPQGSS